MDASQSRVAVVGSGGFGTALSVLMSRKGIRVQQWCRNPDLAETLNNRRENPQYLPGVKIPLETFVTTNAADAVAEVDAIIMAVPSQAMRTAATSIADHIEDGVPVVSVAKGLEQDTYLRMTQVLEECLPRAGAIAALSGPNHAEELARDQPGATVIASKDAAALPMLCELISTDRFKAYPRTDVVGVELAGVLKNITAVAAGLTVGAGYGDNSVAAVITLGLDEMISVGNHFGAKPRTFTGLAGLGDLIATATSEHSRNRRLGALVGKGLTYQEALASMKGQVAEGVRATKFVHEIAQRDGLHLPLTEQIYKVLYEGLDVQEAIHGLLDQV